MRGLGRRGKGTCNSPEANTKIEIVMLLLWLDLNSSYAHSSLALPAIHAQVEGKEGNMEWRKVSATINSNVGSVVAEIVAARPDVVAATAWLFTHVVEDHGSGEGVVTGMYHYIRGTGDAGG